MAATAPPGPRALSHFHRYTSADLGRHLRPAATSRTPPRHERRAARWPVLVPFAGLFSGVLIVSLILAGKIAQVGGLTFTAAVVVLPLSYLFGDVLTEVYGSASARKVVMAGFAVQLIWIASEWIAAALPSGPFWPHQQAFETALGATPRIALAGMGADLGGEFLNAYVLARRKLALGGRFLALRLIASTVAGQAVDSALFLTLAFAGPLPAGERVRLGLSV
ncbi:queuosine precursor transporter [Methylobacterium sp. Leaf118]|uniref:queuosine precursor transporter n=1 Tax=Methylobacterium sp. Leaf118 TaxID=2876562 RepID=UPI001E4AE05D|nr:queuosine precursor transporter [Methylobacterium sp. Leaf118]